MDTKEEKSTLPPSLPCYTKHCLMLKQQDNIKCPFFCMTPFMIIEQTYSNLIVHKSNSSFNNRKRTLKNENKMRIEFEWQLEITLKGGWQSREIVQLEVAGHLQ